MNKQRFNNYCNKENNKKMKDKLLYRNNREQIKAKIKILIILVLVKQNKSILKQLTNKFKYHYKKIN